MDPSTQPILLPSSPNPEALIESIEDSFSDSARSTSPRNSNGPDEAVFDSNPESHSTGQSSPHPCSEYNSHGDTDNEEDCTDNEDDPISSVPPESHATSCIPSYQRDALPYTPPKTRSPFRNPSSIRNMQLEITPPHLRSPTTTSRRSQQSRTQYRLSNTSHNSTPRSVRSHFSTRHSPPKPAPSPKKEHPLVLLHVTLLPISSPYSTTSLAAIAPPHILANWTLLREKVPDTVLERGILIPHPREDYELLEERLLESLELATPRILKCGHFWLEPEEEAAALAEAREEEEEEEVEREREREDVKIWCGDSVCVDAAHEEQNDLDLCTDCGRRVRDGRAGSAGTGSRRWDIRIYAANGLMRAGAWGAAWREMERVDVEICPWMEDSVRRALDEARAAEEREAGLAEMEGAGAVKEGEGSPCFMDEGRRREIYGVVEEEEAEIAEGKGREGYDMGLRGGEASTQAFIDGLEDTPGPDARETKLEKTCSHPVRRKRRPTAVRTAEVPLRQLLFNYVHLLMQDRKNVALVILSFLVFVSAMRSGEQSFSTTPASLAPVTAPTASAIEILSASSLPLSVVADEEVNSEVVPASKSGSATASSEASGGEATMAMGVEGVGATSMASALAS